MQLHLEVKTPKTFFTKVRTYNRQAHREAIQFGLKTTILKITQTLIVMITTLYYNFSIGQKSHMKINCIVFIFKHYNNNITDYQNSCQLIPVKKLSQ